MQVAKARRGRPKGSGIDDTDRIARVLELIRREPGLRPTTAIRQMGITDPSAIRRIRDKYNRFIRAASPDAQLPQHQAYTPVSHQASTPAAAQPLVSRS